MNKELMMRKYNRRVKRYLPEYDLPRPPGPLTLSGPIKQDTPLKLKSDKECCVIFALYMAYDGIIPHYVINSSFWAAHAWRVNTDCIENRWDIYFLVDRKLWVPEVVAMFEKAEFTDFVLFFDVPEGRVIRHKLGTKLYASTVPYFQNFYRCYMVDTDMFPSIRNPENIIKTKPLMDIGEDETLFMTYRYSEERDRHRKIARQKYETDIEEKARPIWDSYVKEYLGYVPNKERGVTGQLFAWNPQQLRQDFKDMVIQLTPNISDDEFQYVYYLEKTGLRPQKLADIWGIPIHYAREDYFDEHPQYFDHIWLKQNEQDMETWGKHATQGELPPMNAYEDPDIKNIWRKNIGLYKRLTDA